VELKIRSASLAYITLTVSDKMAEERQICFRPSSRFFGFVAAGIFSSHMGGGFIYAPLAITVVVMPVRVHKKRKPI